MAKLTILIDNWGHKELNSYLSNLNGILKIEIKNEKILEIYLEYNPNLITCNIIRMEIILFLDISNIPSILAFDKHSMFETSLYKIIIKDICCEYCFKGAIDELFNIEGIEKVESNFNETYYHKNNNDSDNIIINVWYNSSLINIEKMKQIELKLNL